MRDHSQHREVSRTQAAQLLLDSCHFEPKTEKIPLDQAFGRILASDAKAQLDMPNCLTCCMDSVAVHWSDFENGMPDTSNWQRGREWEFANTGIGMPEGYDTAIVIEHVQLTDDLSSISFDAAPSKQFAGTRPAGSRCKKGEVLVEAGAVLTPLLISHIASGNNTEVEVLVKPKVAFIPTGNELVARGSEVPRGKNIETNSLLIQSKIEQWGGEAVVFDAVPDNQEAIKEAVLKACSMADIVVLNAGSSKGSDDWNVEMLEEVGTVLYHETNHGPGHHSSGAVVEGTPVVGISGPPGGAAFTTDFYLKPLMQKYLGQETAPRIITARLAEAFPKGGKHLKKGAAPGETRPSIVDDAKEFFGIKQMRLTVGADGMLEAFPATSSHPSPVEASGMSGYYALSSIDGSPEVGSLIEVELRA